VSSISNKKKEHYFSLNPRSKFQRYEVKLVLKSRIFKFKTSTGVFSHKKVDLGTKVLLKYSKIPIKGTIADLGCGYGIIGIVISKLNPKLAVHFYEINKRAIQLTRKNVELHNLTKYEIYEGDFLDSLNENRQFYDAMYINPPIKIGQDIYVSKIMSAIEFLNKNSSIFIIIKRNLGAQGFINKIRNIFMSKEELDTINIKIKKSSGYWLIEIKKLK